jgi:fucose 4-O-acetylase-like acetyltransferase
MAATRDPWLDNAKMALVTLVVIGHGWTVLPQTALNSHVYDFLYAWHIPAFVFVTGYLSRSFDYTPDRLWQLFRMIVVPYLLFECAMALFRVHLGGERLEHLFADPHWPMWYLAALFFWRLMTPIFRPMWGGVVAALVISLLAGLWFGDTLDLARVFGLLPFFVLGLKATPEHLERLRARWVKVAAVLVFVGIAVITRYTDRLAATEWLYYRSRYDEMNTSDAEAVVIRLVVLALGLLGAFAFLALVPRVGGWFTRMGAYTLVVYLFHGFVVKGVSFTGFPGWAVEHPAISLALVTPASLVLALLLAWRPLASRLQEVVDPFGYAQHHARHAVHITLAADAEPLKVPPAVSSPAAR